MIEITKAEIEGLPAPLKAAWENIKTMCDLKPTGSKFKLSEQHVRELKSTASGRKGLRLLLRALGTRRSIERVKSDLETDKKKSTTSRVQKRSQTTTKNQTKKTALEESGDPTPPSPGKKRNDK